MALKILMTTMSLGIGGAETHIVELAKELSRRGHEVIVASNGGIYVREIEAEGIRHYTVPMHRRSAADMLRSYFRLREIIREECPDVVHAHARIPAFICALLKKTMRFPFVTTAHWVFNTEGMLKYLSNWGQKTVAVSDDIKEYLINNYKIKDRDIIVTINGIDTERFSPHVSGAEVAAELGLDTACPILSHVSRMDEDRALAARHLVENAEYLDRLVPGIQIVMVGGGNVYDELVEKSNLLNIRMGRKCVFMAGPRSDIERMVAVGDVFVGVSRAALEAMSAAKPVIIAGNEGYMGPFTPDKLELARETNFCCRGCDMIDGESLVRDIAKCFNSLNDSQREIMGQYGRDVVMEHYSVARMAEDCEKAYFAVIPKRYNVLMSGYYGFGNLGDEAILESICRNVSGASDEVDITILSNDPEDTEIRCGYKAVHRFAFFKVLMAMRKCDVLISGGGSLLQDKTSTRSLIYYLSIIKFAKLMKKKVMLYANGIGPVNKPSNRKRVCSAISGVDVITLRDKTSAEELREMGVIRDDMRITADPVFTMPSAGKERAEEILADAGVPEDRPFVAVSVRKWKGAPALCEKVAELCDEIAGKHGRSVVFVLMQRESDGEISRRIQGLMSSPSYIIESQCTAREAMAVLGQADFVLSMRLHALIFAARMSVPTVGLVYDPKMECYLEELEMPSAGEVESLDTDQAKKAVRDMAEGRMNYVLDLQKISARLERAAHKNEMYLMELLEKDRR